MKMKELTKSLTGLVILIFTALNYSLAHAGWGPNGTKSKSKENIVSTIWADEVKFSLWECADKKLTDEEIEKIESYEISETTLTIVFENKDKKNFVCDQK